MTGNVRNNNIDIFRILAALGVIAIHVQSNAPGIIYLDKSLNPLCVSFFYLISAVFFVQNIYKQTFNQIALNTGLRILVPYLFWTLIYVSLLYIKSVVSHKEFSLVVWRTLFYGESAMHLYYLPSLIILQIIILSMYYLMLPELSNKINGFFLFTAAFLYLLIGDIYNCFAVSQSGKIISFLLFAGVAFGVAPKLQLLTHSTKVFFIGVLLVFCVILLNWYDYRLVVLEYPLLNVFGGIGGVLICVGAPKITIPNWMVVVSSMSYGIYLSHVVFLEALEFIVGKCTPDLYVSVVLKLFFVFLIFTCAVIFTLTIRKIPILRKILLGEYKQI